MDEDALADDDQLQDDLGAGLENRRIYDCEFIQVVEKRPFHLHKSLYGTEIVCLLEPPRLAVGANKAREIY